MSSCGCSELFVGNDMPITLEGLHSSISGASIIDASVVAQLLDSVDAQVGTDVVLVYDATTDRYVGILEASTPMVAGSIYTVSIVASNGDGYEGKWVSDPIVAENRGFC